MKAKTENIIIKFKADTKELEKAIKLAKELEVVLKRVDKYKPKVKAKAAW